MKRTWPQRRTGGTARAACATLLVLAVGACSAPATPTPEPGDVVVLVSFDGMRHDYIARAPTPAFDRLAAAGAHAALVPSYPSKTFPNHYTIVTGLYPARHGIVDNLFYDPLLDAEYRHSAAAGDDGRWYGGVPVWVAAERAGLRAATIFWPGSEAEIGGVRPSYWLPYDEGLSDDARVAKLLGLLAQPAAERPRFLAVYFSLIDDAGHEHGPDDPRVDAAVVEADRLLGLLLDGLEHTPVAARAHVVVVSDHGMMHVPDGNVAPLDAIAGLDGVRLMSSGTLAHVYTHDPALADKVAARLADAPHVRVLRPAQVPPHWRYERSPRIGDLLLVADDHYVLGTGARGWSGRGQHGYDPAAPDMHGVFVAAGPHIAPVGRLPAFENVHVYPLLLELLGLRPTPGIDGSIDVLRRALAPAALPATTP